MSAGAEAASTSRRRLVGVLLLVVFFLALGVRALGFEWVFVDGHTVVFAPGDAQYHVRRALYAWTNFPHVLFFDPYINYPGGAAISWPPLFDFVLAALGRVFARDPHGFQVFLAWASPVIGALAVWPVHALGRRLGGPFVGLGAAVLIALFPMSTTYSRVGQLDHHCAVALIGAALLLVVARLVDEERPTPGGVAGLAAGQIAMLLTWHGSLLYLALVHASLWLGAAFTGRRAVYGAQALATAVTFAVVAPLVWVFPEPLGGAWSAIALSRLHVAAVFAAAVVSAGMWWLEGRGRAHSPGLRLACTGGFALLVVAMLLALPGPRHGLEPGLRFLTMSDGVGQRTGEQLPLFAIFGRATGRPVWEVWGLFGYAIPILPFAVAWVTRRERRAMGWVVAGWCAWFGALALVQRRYGNDLGPAAAVGFAIVLATVGRRAAEAFGGRRVWGALIAGSLALGLLSPPIVGQLLPRADQALRVWRGEYSGGDRALATLGGTLTRFLEQVRQATPETAGYFDVHQRPEYGVVSHPNLGHAIQNVAHRPTPADPFWAFIGIENWNDAFALLGAASEDEGVSLARRLSARYVLTFSSADPATLEGWLHYVDGLAAGPWPATGHFRLVTEGPEGGVHFSQGFQLRGPRATGSATVPYKLFEVVEGAVLEVPAEPGAEVLASVRLGTPLGRRFRFETRAVADGDGVARLRVPYPTRPAPDALHVGAFGPYRVVVGGTSRGVAVSEEAVRTGAVVKVASP